MSLAVRPKNITRPLEQAVVHLLIQPRIDFIDPADAPPNLTSPGWNRQHAGSSCFDERLGCPEVAVI